MATQPVLVGTTLPHPSDFSEITDYRGGSSIKASGVMSLSLVQGSAKKTFSMSWRALTSAEKATIESAIDALMTSGGGFTAPDGTSYTTGKMDITEKPEFTYIYTNNGFRFSFRLNLRED